MVPDFAAPASRQHQKHWRRLVPSLLLVDAGPQHADLPGQGMTDIAAGRTAQPAILLRFERQQGEYMVDIAEHGARPAGPPRPDRGGDVVNDRYRGIAGPNPSCPPIGSSQVLDDHANVRRG